MRTAAGAPAVADAVRDRPVRDARSRAVLSAQTLYDRGVEDGNAGRHARAARALALAASRTKDPDLSARIAGTRAYLVAETGDPDEALSRCRAALDTPRLSEHTRAVLLSQIGLIELRRGDLDAALHHLTASTGALADDPARLGRVVLNRGLVHLERGAVGRAERDFAWAGEQFAASGEAVEQAKARHNEGYVALVRGELVQSLRLMDGAREVLARLSPVARAVCDLDRAAALRAAGETTEAVRLLTDAAHTFGTRRLRQTQAEAELVLAATLLPTDSARAAAAAHRAARRFRARGNELGTLRAQACALTAAVLAAEPSDGADVRRAAALRNRLTITADALAARRLRPEAASLRLQRARLDVRTGRLSEAQDALRRARVPDHAPVTARLLADEVRAELAKVQGRPARVLACAAAGLDELERWQSAFGSIDLQSSAAAHGRTLVLTGVRAAVQAGDPRTVLEWSERARALASRVPPLRPPADPQTADDLAELRRLRMLDPSPVTADGAREAELRARIRRRTWARDAAAGAGPIASLEEARAGLDAGDADLLAYLWDGDRLTALVVADDARTVDLGEWSPVRKLLDGMLPDLDTAGADLPAPMGAVVRAGLLDRLRRLEALLVEPVRGLLGRRRVVLTPPGVLSGVPWSMLPSLDGVSLTQPPSVTRWLTLRRTDLVLTRAGFAVGPGVARGPEEVRAAAVSWSPRDVLLDGDATTDAVADLARSVDVLHVAAHGRHSPDNPLFSGLELADGPWFGYDIDRLDHVPSVVVLSACELGRSASGWGREALGMAQAWLHAGARCVVAAGSAVNDSLAGELLPVLHHELASGRAPSDALCAAMGSTGARTTFAVHGAGW